MSRPSREGSALLLALVTLVILSSVMVSFLFRIRLESELAVNYRFRMKARALAGAGQEYAKLMLLKSIRPGTEPEDEYGEEFFVALKNLERGLAVSGYAVEMGDGSFTLHIAPEQGRRNVNRLSEADWEQMLENRGVPDELHGDLVASFLDWTDTDEASRLKGAESDAPFYEDRGYPVKNAPVDTLDELLLIKGFTPAILYGGHLEEQHDMPDTRVEGIAPLLTVYGEGTVNLNAASREVLLSVSGMTERQADRVLEGRTGLDDEIGTEDDGFQNTAQAIAFAGLPADSRNLFTTTGAQYIRVTSIGEAGGVRAGIWAVYEFNGRSPTVLYFREEELP